MEHYLNRAHLEPGLELSQVLRSDLNRRPASGVLPELLRAARRHLGTEIGFISQFEDGYRIFRYVDEENGCELLEVGSADPLEEGYCQRVVDGRLPQLIHNAQELPASRELPVTAALGIGAHLSVPIKLANGEVYGTFCCFSSEADYSLNERDLALMHALADMAGALIQKELDATRLHDEKRKRVEGVLEGDCFGVLWQPITDIERGDIVGVEALARFATSPVRTPDVWFAEAATVGLGDLLERRAVEKALEGLHHLPAHVYIACNVSARALLSGKILDLLEGSPLNRIVLEITEHDVVNDYQILADVLRPLRKMGLRLAVDDAGAGYSSFRHILRLKPDLMKLDMSLTRDIDTDLARAALAEAMVRFAHKTGSGLIAEGVESAAELEALKLLGVDEAQGYFLHEPMPTSELMRLLWHQA